MKKALRSFGMGMSMAIAAAIAAVPTAYAADAAADSIGQGNRCEAQDALGWRSGSGLGRPRRHRRPEAQPRRTCRREGGGRRVHLQPLPRGPSLRRPPRRSSPPITRAKASTLVAINVSNIDADKLPAMKERAEEKGFKFDYLYDPSQEIGRAYGATVTPHVFLLDGERNVAYIGADRRQHERSQGHQALPPRRDRRGARRQQARDRHHQADGLWNRL